MWQNSGVARPPFAVSPGPGQESVWDYPRPPLLEPDARRVEVRVGDTSIAQTSNAVRILETASPPTFYLPPADVRMDLLERAPGESRCEWKGVATYWDVVVAGERLEAAAWSYPDPFPEFQAIRGFLSFYPARLACFVAGERVAPQPGGFYGGWVTRQLVGPFKGEPGTDGW
jgi:uncharacterized protein (DUF427 family)